MTFSHLSSCSSAPPLKNRHLRPTVLVAASASTNHVRIIIKIEPHMHEINSKSSYSWSFFLPLFKYVISFFLRLLLFSLSPVKDKSPKMTHFTTLPRNFSYTAPRKLKLPSFKPWDSSHDYNTVQLRRDVGCWLNNHIATHYRCFTQVPADAICERAWYRH